MKKVYTPILAFCLLLLIFSVPLLVVAAGLVPCNGPSDCQLPQVKQMLQNILNFLVMQIATPLAILALVVGAILVLVSAGNPRLSGLGKTIIFSAIIGFALAWCTDLIINFVLNAIGASGYTISTQ